VAAWDFIVKLAPQQWLDAGGSVKTLLTAAAWESWENGNLESIQQRIGSVLPMCRLVRQ
jgi:hypothetical protein